MRRSRYFVVQFAQPEGTSWLVIDRKTARVVRQARTRAMARYWRHYMIAYGEAA
jgi:hypothetical protein